MVSGKGLGSVGTPSGNVDRDRPFRADPAAEPLRRWRALAPWHLPVTPAFRSNLRNPMLQDNP